MLDRPLRINSRAAKVRYHDVVVDRFEVRTLPIEDLWQTVPAVPAFADEIQTSISTFGLVNPIIIVRLPLEDVTAHFKQKGYTKKNIVNALPDRPVLNVIWGGGNRVEVIRRMGYTHVDCVILHDFALATEVQNRQRATYREIKAGKFSEPA